MRWVYASGTTKKPKLLVTPTKQNKSPGGFWGGLSAFLSNGANTPQRIPTPLPAEPDVGVDPLSVTDTQVTLSVFSADVNVQLSTKMSAELHRSTKKNPPSKLKYELIYVSTFFHEICPELMNKNVGCRQRKINMMLASRKMKSNRLRPEVYSKGYVRT